MGISSAAYDSLSPTDLDNFTNPLRLPGDDGVMGILDASDTPLRVTTCRESIEVLPGKRSEVSAYRVERDGKIYLNQTVYALEALRPKLQALYENRRNQALFLRADAEVTYGNVVRVMDEVKKAGIVKLGMITQPVVEKR